MRSTLQDLKANPADAINAARNYSRMSISSRNYEADAWRVIKSLHACLTWGYSATRAAIDDPFQEPLCNPLTEEEKGVVIQVLKSCAKRPNFLKKQGEVVGMLETRRLDYTGSSYNTVCWAALQIIEGGDEVRFDDNAKCFVYALKEVKAPTTSKVSDKKAREREVAKVLKRYLASFDIIAYEELVLGKPEDADDAYSWNQKHTVNLDQEGVSRILDNDKIRRLTYGCLHMHDVASLDIEGIESDLHEYLRIVQVLKDAKKKHEGMYPSKSECMLLTIKALFDKAPLFVANKRVDELSRNLACAQLEHGITDEEIEAAIQLHLANKRG